MKNKLIITLLTTSLMNLGLTFFALKSVEMHSVHPIYGIYQQKIFGCQPWDACTEKKDRCK